IVQSVEGGGWGGRPGEDGMSATVSACQGDVRNGSIEGIELKCPVLVQKRALRKDSGGAGKTRGGLGIEVQVKNFAEGRWNFERASRKQCPAWGLWGGGPGEPAGYKLREAGKNDFTTLEGGARRVPVDSEAILMTGGGGGWGDPYDRDPERVSWDVREDYISLDAARERYGVVLNKDLSVDRTATDILREKQRAANGR